MNYLEVFFDEKDIPYTDWELTSKSGEYHYITSDVVIEFILQQTGELREKFEKQIRQIDFNNGSILRFLEYIAKGMIEL